MSVFSRWFSLEAPDTPSGIAGTADGSVLVAVRIEGADARHVGGTRLLTVSDGQVIAERRLPEVAQVHALSVHGDNVWVTDRGAHAVWRYSLDGTLLGVLGHPDRPSDTGCTVKGGEVPRPAGPFNIPTVAVEHDGLVFVSDGYNNARVHVFSVAGDLRHSFGTYGGGVGEFRLPHSLAVTPDGRVLVCDRENSRIQAFDIDGTPRGVWWSTHRPTDIVCSGQSIYVSDLSPQVTRLDPDARVLDQWSVDRSAHNVAVTDSAVYVTHLSLSSISQIKD
jgi:sugar lactone lactonase YvrE